MGLFLFSPLVAGTSYAQCLNAIEASQLVGINVNDVRGHYMGQIDDVVIDPSNNTVSSVILSDIPGMGAERIAIPFSSFTRTGESSFVYNPSEDVYLFYGEAPYWTQGLNSYKSDQSMLENGDRSSQLLGATIETLEGEDVARIDDVVIDTTGGHILYLVLDDVGGMTDRMAAVPFSGFSRKSEGIFVFNTTKDHLLGAPAFSWDNMDNLTYASQIYRYYGLEPYWE